MNKETKSNECGECCCDGVCAINYPNEKPRRHADPVSSQGEPGVPGETMEDFYGKDENR